MLDAWIVEKLKEKEVNRKDVQIPLQLPEFYEQSPQQEVVEEEKRGVLIIE